MSAYEWVEVFPDYNLSPLLFKIFCLKNLLKHSVLKLSHKGSKNSENCVTSFIGWPVNPFDIDTIVETVWDLNWFEETHNKMMFD